MKKLFILLALAVSTMTASAQFLQANKGGATGNGILVNDCNDYNRISFGYSPEFVSTIGSSQTAHGFKAGYLRGFNVTKKLPLFVEGGLDMSFATTNAVFLSGIAGANIDVNHLAFNIPINLTYKLSFNNGIWLEPYAGILFKITALLNMSAGGESVSLYDTIDDLKRFQFGGQFGTNIGYKKFNLNIGYQMYTPLYNEGFSKISADALVLTLGYNF